MKYTKCMLVAVFTLNVLTACNGDQLGDILSPPGQSNADTLPNQTVCTNEYAPVCGTKEIIAPCEQLPCPKFIHSTYGNSCNLSAANARLVFEGECGNKEGKTINRMDGACIQVYTPVCTKTRTDIACVTTPCPTHSFITRGNTCEAQLNFEPIVLESECNGIENEIGEGQPPVFLRSELPEDTKSPSIENANIQGDTLNLQLRYSGCQKQHFDLYASTSILESLPPQVNVVFRPQINDSCEAIITSEHSYDLTPLRHYLESEYSSIFIRNIELLFEF